MKISEKKYQKLFEEAQADAIRIRKERDAALGQIRMIGRLSEDPRIVELCKAAIGGEKTPEGCAEKVSWEWNRRIIEQIRALVPSAPPDDESLVNYLRDALVPNDTARIDAMIEACADIELTCGGVWRVSAYEDYEAPELRGALDKLVAAMAGEKR